MDRLEMGMKLFKNPKLRAVDTDCNDSEVGVRKSTEPHVIGNEIYNIKHGFTLKLSDGTNETWKIIEPELKEFDFGEAYHIYYSEPFQPKIKSCVSGEIYEDEDMGKQTLEELKGKWTIEGYYED